MSPQEPSAYLCEHVRGALARDPRVAAPGLQVTPAAGKLFISGDVPTEAARAAVDSVLADNFPGLVAINAASVVSVGEVDTVEHLP